uniref:HAT C-terminal dimerisation domain-containing protein n=1 Tax=Solanum lycopersicum TaxID=4081 RepID=A0A3Q7GG54_SOLLC
MMLSRVIEYEGAIVEYADRDIGLALYLKFVDKNSTCTLLNSDWEGVKRITKFIEIYLVHDMLHQIFIFLKFVIVYLNQLILNEDQVLAKVAENMKEKFDRYWGDAEKLNKIGGASSKSELVKYHDEETEIEKSDFDVLLWWKVNSPRFLFLSEMTRDVLAIPDSSVASECAFRTRGLILDSFRMFFQDWLQSEPQPINFAKLGKNFALMTCKIGGKK